VFPAAVLLQWFVALTPVIRRTDMADDVIETAATQQVLRLLLPDHPSVSTINSHLNSSQNEETPCLANTMRQ
jgi:hypothetical protein